MKDHPRFAESLRIRFEVEQGRHYQAPSWSLFEPRLHSVTIQVHRLRTGYPSSV